MRKILFIEKLLVCIFALTFIEPVSAQTVNDWQITAQKLVEAERYSEANVIYAKYASKTMGLTKARIFSWWGGCLRHTGAYKEAENKYLVSLNLYKLFDADLSDRVRINLAVLYNEVGRYNDAISQLDSVISPDRKQYAILYRAESMFRMGRNSEAVAACTSLIVRDSIDPRLKAEAYNNRAYMLMEYNDSISLHQAISDFKVALNKFGGSKVEYYITLSNYAITQARCGKFHDAVTNINTAITWFSKNTKSGLYPEYIIVLRKRAEIFMLMNDKVNSLDAYKKYFTQERKLMQSNFACMTEQNRLDIWKKEKPLVSQIFRLEDYAPDFLLDVAVFRREIALLGGNPTSKLDSIRWSGKISTHLSLKGADIRRCMLPNEIAIDFVKYEKPDSASGSNVAWYGALIIPPMNGNKKVAFIPLWKEKELNDFNLGGRTLLSAVCSPGRQSDKNQIYTSKALANFILSPLNSAIKGAKNVYFVPDGLLHMLAIEHLHLLVDSLHTTHLHRLSSVSSLYDRKNAVSIVEPKKILAIGGINYDRVFEDEKISYANHDAMDYLDNFIAGKNVSFNYLPGTKKELILIDSLKIGADTTSVETELKFKHITMCNKFRLIHLATHGYALQVVGETIPYAMRDSLTEDRSLLASGIALTGANKAYKYTELEDGIVSAREFCDMDLSNVELMVLSACQSAQGVVSDEGPAGLIRGLKKAGVKSIVATLWEVDDESTNIFMRAFYSSLKNCSDVTCAMQAGREAVRNYKTNYGIMRFNPASMAMSYEEGIVNPYDAPYYWAPFILIED